MSATTPTRIKISIDTREQSPWVFPEEFATTCRATIPTGDYSLAGDELGFAIERKSLNDFLGTISTGWERFRRELTRMRDQGFPARVVIIESNARDIGPSICPVSGDIIPAKHNHPKITPQFALSRIADLTINGVSVLFAGDAAYAAIIALTILRKRDAYLRAERMLRDGNDNGDR